MNRLGLAFFFVVVVGLSVLSLAVGGQVTPEQKFFVFFPFVTIFALGSLYFWGLVVAFICFAFFAIDDDEWGKCIGLFALFWGVLFAFGDFNIFAWTKDNLHLVGKSILIYAIAAVIYGTLKWLWYNIQNKIEYKHRRRTFLREHGIALTAEIPENLKYDWMLTVCGYDPQSIRKNFDRNYNNGGRYFGKTFYKSTNINAQNYEKTWEAGVEDVFASGSPKRAAVNYDIGFPPNHWLEVRPDIALHKHTLITWMMWWPLSLLWTIIDDFIKDFFNRIYLYMSTLWQRMSDWVWKDTLKDFGQRKPTKTDEEDV